MGYTYYFFFCQIDLDLYIWQMSLWQLSDFLKPSLGPSSGPPSICWLHIFFSYSANFGHMCFNLFVDTAVFRCFSCCLFILKSISFYFSYFKQFHFLAAVSNKTLTLITNFVIFSMAGMYRINLNCRFQLKLYLLFFCCLYSLF